MEPEGKDSPKEEVTGEAKISKIRSKFNDPKLDLEWLYNTLRKEISKEVVYNLENDAKLRAVTQGTVDYEQFRQMVLGAQIKPLGKKDKVEGCQNGRRPNVVWNTVTSSGVNSSSTVVKEGEELKEKETLFNSMKN